MSKNPSLRELQQWLKWMITDPRGVSEALNEPTPNIEKYKNRYISPTASFFEIIVSDRISSFDRLDIYAEGYFSRILDVLSETFSRTRKAVGEDFFTMLTAQYLKAYPSKFSSIDEVGKHFSRFLYETESERLPLWVCDLANFEWNWVESFYAREAIVTPNWKNILASSHQVSLKVNPSVRFISSRHSLAERIQNIDADKEASKPDDEESASFILIYRVRDEVLWKNMDSSMFLILKKLCDGVSFEKALSQSDTSNPQLIGQYFSHWVENEIICGVLD